MKPIILICRKCTKGVCLGFLAAKASVYKIKEGEEYTDEEIDRLMACGFCKTALYRFAGNSIVVGTLAAVMECALFPIRRD